MIEGLVFRLWKECSASTCCERYPSGAFPRLNFAESMRRFGNDKPDMRFGLEHVDLTELVVEHKGGGIPCWSPSRRSSRRHLPPDLPEEIVQGAGGARTATNFSRKDLESLEKYVNGMGAKGLARAKVEGADGAWVQSPLAKMVTDEFRLAVNAAVGAQDGDLILFQFGKSARAHRDGEPAPPPRQAAQAHPRVRAARRLEPPVGGGPAALRARRGGLGRRAPRLHAPARRVRGAARRPTRARCSATATTWCSTASRSAAAPSACTTPRCRRRSSRRIGISRGGGPGEVRLPARRAHLRRAPARRHRRRHGPHRHAGGRDRVASAT
jgi:hypothetical protein